MIGDLPKYQIFLSYRVAYDQQYVEMLYDILTQKLGLTVWLDKKCLLNGMKWEEGFCKGLMDSTAFVCLISGDAVNHPTNTRSSFTNLTHSSPCDNVLLEHQLALEFREQGLLQHIFPIFVGQKNALDPTKLDNFSFGNFAGFSDTVVVDAVLEKLKEHMDREALGSPLNPTRSVKQTMNEITANQGGFWQGDIQSSLDSIAQEIHKMCTSSPQTSQRCNNIDKDAELEALRLEWEKEIEEINKKALRL